MTTTHPIAVIIPCFKVKRHILDLLSRIGPEVNYIYVVDDACPEQTGHWVENHCDDTRVHVLYHTQNQGVGGAVMTGYQAAIQQHAAILVKLDGDGQMDPALIPSLISPIKQGLADYTKGNRFFNLEKIRTMPTMRLFGNAWLSLLTKLSTGYWDIFDPTNGYTALHANVARYLPFNKISSGYFFESDMLFRLNTLRAVVMDIPMDACYGDEVSHLVIHRIVGEFLKKHIKNCFKRLFYNYYLRNMSLASIELPLGVSLLLFGLVFGGTQWAHSASLHLTTPVGTIMLSAISALSGLQFVLAFLNYDINHVCKTPLHLKLADHLIVSPANSGP